MKGPARRLHNLYDQGDLAEEPHGENQGAHPRNRQGVGHDVGDPGPEVDHAGGAGGAVTVMISELPTDQWYAAIGDTTLADTILDRLMHNAHRLPLKGESMRRIRVGLMEGEKLE